MAKSKIKQPRHATAEESARFLEEMYAARRKWWDEHGQRLWEERQAERKPRQLELRFEH